MLNQCGLALSVEQQATIQQLIDPEQLRETLRRAVGAASTSEVFDTTPD